MCKGWTVAGRKSVAVLGGGVAGLTAADALTGDVDVTLIELTGTVGGKLRSGELEGVQIDEGAESFLVRRPEAARLAENLGLPMVYPRAKGPDRGAYVLIGDRLRRLPTGTQLGIPGDLPMLAWSRVLAPHQLARVALERLIPRGPLKADQSVGELVRKRMGRAVVERLVDPLMGGVYAGRADGISVAAALPFLYAAMRTEGSLLAAAQGLQAAAPPSDLAVFGSVDGGADRLTNALAGRILSSGGRVVLGSGALSIERDGTGWSVGLRDGNQNFDAVVVATPAIAASKLLRSVAVGAADLLSEIEYANIGIVNLLYDVDQVQSAAGFGYLVVERPGRVVKAVTFIPNKWQHRVGLSTFLIRASVGRYGDTAALTMTDDELIARVHAEVAPAAGLTARPRAAKVTRWGGALPQYAPGHLDRVASIRAGLPAGIVVAGAAYDGVGIPACVGSGNAAADQVLRHLKHERNGGQAQGA